MQQELPSAQAGCQVRIAFLFLIYVRVTKPYSKSYNEITRLGFDSWSRQIKDYNDWYSQLPA